MLCKPELLSSTGVSTESGPGISCGYPGRTISSKSVTQSDTVTVKPMPSQLPNATVTFDTLKKKKRVVYQSVSGQAPPAQDHQYIFCFWRQKKLDLEFTQIPSNTFTRHAHSRRNTRMESGAWNRTLPPLPGELSYYSTDSDDRRYVAVARSRSFSHFSTFAIEKQVLSSRYLNTVGNFPAKTFPF